MSLKTAFLNLFKPEAGDRFSITGTEGYNKNMDLIDAAVKKNADDINQLNSDIDLKANILKSKYDDVGNINRIKITVPKEGYISCCGIVFHRYGVATFYITTDSDGSISDYILNVLVGEKCTGVKNENTCMINLYDWNRVSLLISANVDVAKKIVVTYEHA